MRVMQQSNETGHMKANGMTVDKSKRGFLVTRFDYNGA